jgi:phosphotransferase system enzyme I (PtsP)
MDSGSKTSHAVIVARSMKIPSVVGMRNLTSRVTNGDWAIVDGYDGVVILNPSESTLFRYGKIQEQKKSFEARLLEVNRQPAITLDGVTVPLLANIEKSEEVTRAKAYFADGIGLFRTEFQFLISATLPGRERQHRLYSKVLAAAGDKPVVFRTVDIGGDKALPYLTDIRDEAENPSMGWRALRLSLERSALMKAQARALVEASGGKVLRVMFPMISEPWEFDEARALFEEQIDWARKSHRKLPSRVEFGAMLEVPSLAEVLDLLLPKIDFLSIGTNDLTQFLFAADRADPRLAERYDWLSPSILRFLRRVSREARDAGVPVRVCGEMGGRPLEAMALIGLGIEQFSITPAAIGPIKAMVRSLDAGRIRGRVEQLLNKPPANMRKALSDWARRHKIAIG